MIRDYWDYAQYLAHCFRHAMTHLLRRPCMPCDVEARLRELGAQRREAAR